jgi:hypothetical protein
MRKVFHFLSLTQVALHYEMSIPIIVYMISGIFTNTMYDLNNGRKSVIIDTIFEVMVKPYNIQYSL